MLSSVFENYTGFMVSALGLNQNMKPILVNDILILQIPITFEAQLREFLCAEGLTVTQYNKNVFWVTIVC